MSKFHIITSCSALGLSLLLASCTASEQTSEAANPSVRVPTQVNSDADRRAIYNSNGTGVSSSVPDATPNRVRLGEQVSDINRQKRIENVNTNDPNTSSPETRMQRLNYDAPVMDTSRLR